MKHGEISNTRSILPLIEQLLMLLVFMLAAAICLRAFVHASLLSQRNAARDHALLCAQELAETLKYAGSAGEDAYAYAAAALGGAQEGESILLGYDEDWQRADDALRYRLGASAVESGTPGLAQAEIWARSETDGQELLRFCIAWQTGGARG